jgi:hypothetical protein
VLGLRAEGRNVSQHEDTVAAWLKEAANDLKSPSLGSVLRWTARAANVKGAATLADRALKQLELLELQCRFRADGMASDAGAQLVMQHGVSEFEMARARADYSTAVELLEFAERVTRLLERPRAKAEQEATKPVGRFVAGGKR